MLIVICSRMLVFGSKGISMVVCWPGVGGATAGDGVWYSTVKDEGEDRLQWNRAISGWIPTNILRYVPFVDGFRRI